MVKVVFVASRLASPRPGPDGPMFPSRVLLPYLPHPFTLDVSDHSRNSRRIFWYPLPCPIFCIPLPSTIRIMYCSCTWLLGRIEDPSKQDRAGRGHMSLNPILVSEFDRFIYYLSCWGPLTRSPWLFASAPHPPDRRRPGVTSHELSLSDIPYIAS